MQRSAVLVVVVATTLLLVALASQSAHSFKMNSQWEDLYLSVPESSRCAEHLQVYTSVPHVASTPGDFETVLYTELVLSELGFTPQRIPFEALVTFPVYRSLELLEPNYYSALLEESYIPEDPTSNDPRVVPTFNAYSPSGNVTAQVVYVNYGQLSDYQALEGLGVQLNGTIHIARYGAIFRGTKAMIAQMYGAKALLIYSDPADDGYGMGPVYPDGPWRPEFGVQRGSAAFISICPGDPSRPNCTNGNPNITTTPSIPVQPISWGDAYPLLSALGGSVAPEEFQGALNFTYHTGPGPAVARLVVTSNFTVQTLWNVVVTINGTSDDIILMGNHRDAWTFGGVDPNSGTAVLLEIARGYSTLLASGWQPNRTIILASWDGEEYGLLGSTNYADANHDLFSEKLVAYINVDTAVEGIPQFSPAGTPSLLDLIYNAALDVTDPETGLPVATAHPFSFPLLGSGSDFTAYLDNLGVPSVDLSFEGPYGVYHSVYDSFHWMTTEGDTTFDYHRAMAQIWGLVGLRLADSPILPFNYTVYGTTLTNLTTQTEDLLQQYNGTTELDLSGLAKVSSSFLEAALNINYSAPELNYVLGHVERQFIGPGLPGRPYYRHVIQAPGLYLGYGADPFPGVSQAIRDQDWVQAQEQLTILVERIGNATVLLGTVANN